VRTFPSNPHCRDEEGISMTANRLPELSPAPRRAAARPRPADGPSDRELLDRVRGGDEAAFNALLARHGRMVLGVCRRSLPRGQVKWLAVVARWQADTGRQVDRFEVHGADGRLALAPGLRSLASAGRGRCSCGSWGSSRGR
jgi:hypothetical protein